MVIVVLPYEALGVQHGKHLGRVSGMPSQQCIQLRIGHRTVRFAERQRHIPGQRQGVRLAKFLVAFPIVLTSWDARSVDGRGDMLRADLTGTGRFHGIPRRVAINVQEIR